MDSKIMLEMIEDEEHRRNLADAVAVLQAQISVEKEKKTKRELEKAWILGLTKEMPQ
jgi:hypothetical protein